MGLLIFSSLLAPVLGLRSPIATALRDQLLPPLGLAGGSISHPLGTDALGRDLLSRVTYGGRTSLTVAAGTIVIGGGVGAFLGLVAGYSEGWWGSLIDSIADATLAMPMILLALLFAVVFGPGFWNVIVVLSLVVWARYARLVRGDVLNWKHREFVDAARGSGASAGRIIKRHLFPNIGGSLIVFASLQVGWVILTEATLSFLGAGVPPPTPTWGSMIAEGRDQLETAWWVSVVPGVAILFTVLAFNLLGDWLRDMLDPRLRRQ